MVNDYLNKRRYPRIRTENPVLLKKVGGDGLEGFAKTLQIGLGGCMLMNDEALGKGSDVDLLISVRGHLIKATGRVIYENPHQGQAIAVGVEFVSLSADDQEALQSLFREQSTVFPEV
jgi:hypothetical protein